MLDELIPLVLIGLYYLLSARKRAQQKRAAAERETAPQEALVPNEAKERTPFQDFMTELELVMAEANGGGPRDDKRDEPVPMPELDRPPSSPARPLPSPTSGEFRTLPGSFDAPNAVDHESHGFGIENPLSEESFEMSPVFSKRAARERREFDPHGLRTPSAPTPARPTSITRRLSDPATAREAFVLQTIFGPRGGIRGDRR